jgi:NAD(P)-dependent dehydrogenase (short-subunit alcohol dehydrogenase family)
LSTGTNRFDLSGKTALVTGGSRGIGSGIAVGLAEHGADVAIVYRSAQARAEQVLETIRGLGRKAWSFQQDLGETADLHALADRARDSCGGIDILVNNAGTAYLEHFNQVNREHWRRVMDVNIDAVFFLTQRVAEHMIADGVKGRIINVSSVNGIVAEAGLAHYNASKGALEMLTQSLAIELGAHGITVNTICPGVIKTEISDEFPLAEGFDEYFRNHIPLDHRLGNIEDCVGAAVFFASPAGGYVTGQKLVVDGGILCEQVPRLQFMPAYKNTIEQKDPKNAKREQKRNS